MPSTASLQRPTRRAFLTVLLAIPLVGGCDDGIPQPESVPTISTESFITTMVELRKAALIREGQQITPAARDQVLREQGVTAEDLLTFAEVHGVNVPFMNEVWAEVEQRINQATFEPAPGEEPVPQREDPEGTSGG